jgi:hypothetical protein
MEKKEEIKETKVDYSLKELFDQQNIKFDKFDQQFDKIDRDINDLKDNHLNHINKSLHIIEGILIVLSPLIIAILIKVFS